MPLSSPKSLELIYFKFYDSVIFLMLISNFREITVWIKNIKIKVTETHKARNPFFLAYYHARTPLRCRFEALFAGSAYSRRNHSLCIHRKYINLYIFFHLQSMRSISYCILSFYKCMAWTGPLFQLRILIWLWFRKVTDFSVRYKRDNKSR